ncbi:MAG: hypothetical protein ACRED3_07450 [Bradyrhizobium sp.]
MAYDVRGVNAKSKSQDVLHHDAVDGESQIRICRIIPSERAVQDPFTDFMTGKLSERHAKQDRRIYAMMYFGIMALIVLAIVNLFI